MKPVRRPPWISVALASCVLAAGCTASQPLQRPAPQPRQAALFGMSKQALLACAGAPVRSETRADVEYLTYLTGTKPAAEVKVPPAVAAASASAGRDRSGYCRVTIGLTHGAVESVTFAGLSAKGLATNPDCMRVIDRCVAP